jgi:DNA-binding MarR family transcriptional regulator
MQRHEEVLAALRRIMRAVEQHSRKLEREVGLSGPQLVLMQALREMGAVPIGALARRVHVSQATATVLVDRLQAKGLAARGRCADDGRKVLVRLTRAGNRLLKRAPQPLQAHFVERFRRLAEWEQTQILSALQRVGEMMDAHDIAAAPLLDGAALDATVSVNPAAGTR